MAEPTAAEIRAIIFSEIKERRYHLDASFQINYLVKPVEEFLRQKFNEPAREKYANLLNDVLWDLMVSGILAPWNSRNREFSHLHVTAYGQKCIESGITLAYDPEGRAIAPVHDRIAARSTRLTGKAWGPYRE